MPAESSVSDGVAALNLPLGAADLVLGKPTFKDQRVNAVAQTQGLLAGWRACWAAHGARAAEQAGGAFAVGLTDAAGRSFLAADPFAMHSLCYRLIDGRLHYAERADTLAALPPAAGIDPQAIFDYLYFHVIPSPRTIFQGVFRVPAGHCVVHDQGGLRVQRYWTPTFREPQGADFQALRGQFRTALQDAVAAQLDGSKPACFLSGGTDSSTVAGMIGLVSGRPAASYSIGFQADGYDEMDYARLAAKHFGTEHHEYYVTPADLVQNIPLVAHHYDQPFGNSSALPAYCCARMARDDGVSHLLAGDGGDELFGGNTRYAKQRVFGWYGQLPTPLQRGLVEPALRSPLGGLPLLRKGRSYVEQARVPLPDRMQMYNLVLRLGVQDVFDAGFLAQVNQADPLAQQRRVWSESEGADPLNRMLAFDWRYTLAETDLPKVCGTTSLAGVSVGFPFLAEDLVNFSLQMPVAYKLRGLKLRWFFKEALRGFLPDDTLTKKKQGFGLPFGVWANQNQALRSLAGESLHALGERGIVRHDFVRQLMQNLMPAHPGYYGEMVWILMMLEQWIRQSPSPDYRIG